MPARLSLMSTVTICFLCFTGASTGQTNEPHPASRSGGQIVWGQITNGFSGGIRISNDGEPSLGVGVFVRQTVATNTTLLPRGSDLGPPYLGASNGFCGPIELRDVAGKKIELKRPAVSLSDAYPSTLRWSVLMAEEMRRRGPSHTVPGDRGFFGSDGMKTTGQLSPFDLRDYFIVKTRAEYQLTVWPKIYKQNSDDKDLYQRIDLPPVTVAITWGSE